MFRLNLFYYKINTNSIKLISEESFTNCSSIEKISIISNIKPIGKNASTHCSKIKKKICR